MYQSTEAHPGLSQAFKINPFARIVDVFELTFLTIFGQKYHQRCLKSSGYTFGLFQSRQLIKCFPIHELIKQFWRHQTCKLYQNRLAFVIVFGIHCNFFIVLFIQLKTYSSNVFFFFTRENVHAKKIGLEILLAQPRPIGIGRAICPALGKHVLLIDTRR